jgi:hypothetical protein
MQGRLYQASSQMFTVTRGGTNAQWFLNIPNQFNSNYLRLRRITWTLQVFDFASTPILPGLGLETELRIYNGDVFPGLANKEMGIRPALLWAGVALIPANVTTFAALYSPGQYTFDWLVTNNALTINVLLINNDLDDYQAKISILAEIEPYNG